MPADRHLVALESDAPADARARIAAIGRVGQAMPPRLLVVEAPADRAAALRRLAGVRLLDSAVAGDALAEPLNDGERLFVHGFFAMRHKSAPMAGESLAWDAPGMTPPDPPPGPQPGTGRQG